MTASNVKVRPTLSYLGQDCNIHPSFFIDLIFIKNWSEDFLHWCEWSWLFGLENNNEQVADMNWLVHICLFGGFCRRCSCCSILVVVVVFFFDSLWTVYTRLAVSFSWFHYENSLVATFSFLLLVGGCFIFGNSSFWYSVYPTWMFEHTQESPNFLRFH